MALIIAHFLLKASTLGVFSERPQRNCCQFPLLILEEVFRGFQNVGSRDWDRVLKRDIYTHSSNVRNLCNDT